MSKRPRKVKPKVRFYDADGVETEANAARWARVYKKDGSFDVVSAKEAWGMLDPYDLVDESVFPARLEYMISDATSARRALAQVEKDRRLTEDQREKIRKRARSMLWLGGVREGDTIRLTYTVTIT